MAAVGYEQRRIRTIRSTWIILVVTLVLAGAIAALLGGLSNLDPETGERLGQASLRDVLTAAVNPIVLVPVSVLAAMAFGGEYRFGLIRQTLTTFPGRTKVFLAKLWVVVLWMLAFLILATAVVVGVAYLFRSNVDVDPLATENITYALRALAFGVLYGLFTFALVVITRNQALSIVIVILWTVVLESLLVGLLGDRFEWLPDVLPMTAGAAFVTGDDMARNAAVFVGVLAVLLLAGWGLFVKRDA
ncbi:MAG: ABC transporter permease [Actinobacteria bacterium]|nr:ABC transporter permease [Actinomycetota bacterium]MCB9411847.1 ABC transporter permease [Actinomycetota bacterium]